MKHLFVIVTSLALLAALALPAAARGGKKPPRAQPGQTCEALVENGAIWDPGTWVVGGDGHSDGDHYDAQITPGHGAICIDVRGGGSGHGAGDWIIDWEIVTPPPAPHVINSILFEMKDSHPGDICWLEEVGDPARVGTLSTGVDGESGDDIPATLVDACGTSWSDPDPALAFLTLLDIHRFNRLLRDPDRDFLINVTLTPPAQPI